MNLAPLVVIAGPTAVGKGTVISELRKLYPQLPLSVSVTTRAARSGEQDGVDYHFVDDVEFDSMITEGALLEWALVHGSHRYGTPREWVATQRSKGTPVLLEVDLEGSRQIKEKVPEARTVFIAPPKFEDLRTRLESRGSESAAQMERRLETARAELAASGEFDHVLINDDVDRTVSELAHIMGLQ